MNTDRQLKFGKELITNKSIDSKKIGDKVVINKKSYEVIGYFMGSASYIKDAHEQIFRVIKA